MYFPRMFFLLSFYLLLKSFCSVLQSCFFSRRNSKVCINLNKRASALPRRGSPQGMATTETISKTEASNYKEDIPSDPKSDMKGSKKLMSACSLSKLKVFLILLYLAYLTKTMSGAYINSMLTQIERRFNIPAYLVGVINGAFEMGDLLVIVFVSYLGSKLHRPRMIGLGCAAMGLGCVLIALPHFLMGRYQYENTASTSENVSSSMAVCLANQSDRFKSALLPSEECEEQEGSLMWVSVLIGNIIRGIGETPITPLGISYVEDFARAENSPFYIGCLQIATVLGPLFGLMIGSYCAQLYVDIGFINLEEVVINLTDARWVGAWWLGVLVCAFANFLVAVPFCFLPKTLVKEGEENKTDVTAKRNKSLLKTANTGQAKIKLRELYKDFVPYLKSLFHNRVYMLFLCITVFQFSAWIGMITFMPKYLEQQYGISASDAIFYIGVYNLPIICAGYFFGGLMMKKFKINTYQAAHIGFWSSLIEYLIYFSAFAMFCKNSSVAGLSVSYKGIEEVSYTDAYLYADCNRHCNCSTKTWDPVCGENGITYVSSCLAGCGMSNGTGKHTVLTNCSCISAPGLLSGNGSALPGQCNRGKTCDTMLQYFLILSLICCLIYSFGAMPGYMVLIRSLKPEEKSFGVGLHSLTERLFAGIPSPIYFGAMIDTACLKWGTKACGGIGACRMYDTDTYRWLYLGLPSALRGVSYIPCVFILLILRKEAKDQTRQDLELEVKEEEREETDQKDMAVFQKCKDPQQETVGTTNADPQKV